jgi:two-component system, NarL family, invasion response regulator UvrY
MFRLFLADDHAIIRQGIKRAVTDMTVVGEASTAAELLNRLPRHLCDVLLLDLALPGESGIRLIPKIKALCPRVRIIVFSMFGEPEYARRALEAGAAGYVLKTASMKELCDAIRHVIAGHTYLSRPCDEQDIREPRPPMKRLSPREKQIMQLIGAGKPMRDIADCLALSPKTVATHRARILEKLQLKSSSDLLRYAVYHGLKESPTV